MTKNQAHKIAVIGGGVSGIAAAHYLLDAGFHIDLFETDSQLGGRIAIDDFEEREVCFGGKNIGLEYKEFRRFISRYITPDYEYFGINSARLIRGQVKPFNSKNKVQAVFNLANAAKLSDFVKLRQAIRAVKQERRNGDLCGPYFQHLCDDSELKISDYYSRNFTEQIIRALTVRMNGAEPDQISLENLGTHLQMLQDEYEQLSTPLSQVFRRFEGRERLKVHRNHRIEAISKSEDVFHLLVRGDIKEYKKIILATPAYISAALVQNISPSLTECLNSVSYNPVGVIIAKYEDPVFTQNVRALTFPSNSPLSNIGAYGACDLDLVRYTFSGQVAAEILHECLDDHDLLRAAEAIATPYFNLAENKCTTFKVKYWPQGLCSYVASQAQFETQLFRELSKLNGLYLTGDYIKGNSIENCFRAANSMTNAVRKSLTSHSSSTNAKSQMESPAHV